MTSDNSVRTEELTQEDLEFLAAVTLERFALGDFKAILEDLDESTTDENPMLYRQQVLIGRYMDRIDQMCEDGSFYDNVVELLKGTFTGG